MDTRLKTSLWYSGIAIFGGIAILLFSLLATSHASNFGSEASLFSSTSTLYVGRELLPDHVLYPVIMAKENLVHKLSSSQEQIALNRAYAQKRLRAAYALAEREERQPLALTTLTKGQKYMLKYCIASTLAFGPQPENRRAAEETIRVYIRDAGVVIDRLMLDDLNSANQLQAELLRCADTLAEPESL